MEPEPLFVSSWRRCWDAPLGRGSRDGGGPSESSRDPAFGGRFTVIVVMKSDATAEQVDHMVSHIRTLGLSPQVIKGTHQTVIAAIGEERPGLTEALEPGVGVEKVLPIM